MAKKFKKVTPHLVTFTLIFMVIFGAFIAVDSLGTVKYQEFIKDKTNDILVNIKYGPEGYGAYKRFNVINFQTLSLFLKHTTGFPFVEHTAVIHYLRFNKPIGNNSLNFIWRIYGVNSSDFNFLNISIKKGVFTNSGLSLREDIFTALNLKIGDVVNLTYVVKENGNYTYKTIFLPITSTFSINNTLVSDFNSFSHAYYPFDILVLAPRDTFLFLLGNLTVSEAGSFIIGDINPSFIDRTTPENSLDYMRNWIDDYYTLPNSNIDVTVYCPIYGELTSYVAWKNELKTTLMYRLIPLLIVAWLVIFYLNRMYLTIRQREIFVAIARGKDRDYGLNMLLKELGVSFAKSLPIGLVLGVPFSMLFLVPVYQLISPIQMQASLLPNQFMIPIAISYLSVVYSVMYCTLIYISILILIGISLIYNTIGKNLLKTTKHGLKRLLINTGLAYSDILLILFSLFVFLLVYDTTDYFSSLNSILDKNFLLQMVLLGSPVAFVVGITELAFRVIHKIANTTANAIKFKSKFFPLFLGFKNISKNTRLDIIAATFALILAFSQANSITPLAYYPSIKAQYHWVVGSDAAIQLSMNSPNVSLVTEIANNFCKNLSTVESHTVMFETSVRIPILNNQFVYIIGIDPDTFLNTMYTNRNRLFSETSYAKIIHALKKDSNAGIISKSLNASYNIFKGDLIDGKANDKLFYVNIKGGMDYTFHYKTFQWGDFESEYDTFRIRRYILTTFQVIESLETYTHVVILIKLKDSKNQEGSVNILKNRLRELERQYIQLLNAKFISAQEYINKKMRDQTILLQLNTAIVSFGASLLLVLVFVWAYTQVLKVKRSRYIAVLIALGASISSVTIAVLSELLFVLVYGIAVSILVSFPLALILGLLAGINGEFITFYLSTTESFVSMGFVILFSLLSSIIGGALIIYFILQREKSQLLKLEWTPEKYLEDLEIVWS